MNPYHKPPGTYKPIITTPISALTVSERFQLMFKDIPKDVKLITASSRRAGKTKVMNQLNHIASTSTLLTAVRLLGATYTEVDEVQFLQLADSRRYRITETDTTWIFRALWADAGALEVTKQLVAEDLKDIILSHVVEVRGPLNHISLRHE